MPQHRLSAYDPIGTKWTALGKLTLSLGAGGIALILTKRISSISKRTFSKYASRCGAFGLGSLVSALAWHRSNSHATDHPGSIDGERVVDAPDSLLLDTQLLIQRLETCRSHGYLDLAGCTLDLETTQTVCEIAKSSRAHSLNLSSWHPCCCDSEAVQEERERRELEEQLEREVGKGWGGGKQ